MVQPRLRATARGDEAQAGDDGVVGDGIAGRGRESVTPAVDHSRVAGVGLQSAAHGLGARGLAIGRFHALMTPGVSGFGHLAKSFLHIDHGPAFFGEGLGQQALHGHIHEVGVAVVGLAVADGQTQGL